MWGHFILSKKMKEGQTSEDRFSFQVMLESSEGTGLIPYVGTYYLTQIVDGEKIYYHFDSENNLVPYSDNDNDNEESLVCGSTGQDGIVSNIPVGFTVAITQILSDTDFKVTEIDPNTGLSSPKYDSPEYEVKAGTADKIGQNGDASGTILLGKNAEVTVTNSLSEAPDTPYIEVQKKFEGIDAGKLPKDFAIELYSDKECNNLIETLKLKIGRASCRERV